MSNRDDLIDEYGRAETAPLGTLADLRVKLDAYRAEVLREAAEVAVRTARACGDTEAGQYAASVAAGVGKELRRMADAAGKDTREGESTRDDAETCGRCRRPFDPADIRFDGRARYGATPFCRGCVDRCHESSDFAHECPVCRVAGGVSTRDDEPPPGWTATCGKGQSTRRLCDAHDRDLIVPNRGERP